MATFTRNEIKMLAEEICKVMKKDFVKVAENAQAKENDKYLNTKEAAEFLGWSIKTLYTRMNELPHIKTGKLIRFKKSKLEQFLERKKLNNKKTDNLKLLLK